MVLNAMTFDLKKLYRKIVFGESLLGVFINPFYISRRALLRCIRQHARNISSGRLLDVGCGSKPYRELFSVDEYIGLDIETSGHDHSSSEVDMFYDGETIPFDDAHFDHVFSSEVFEHVFNLDRLLSEVNRVTKKGGSLLITLPFCWDEHEIPYDFARYSSFGIHSILERHGYKVISSLKTTSYIQTIFQMLAAYVSQCILPENRYARVALTPIFVSPFIILGLFLSKILPDNGHFYLNNAVYCTKQ
jgi:SAM-dependent methyltransferase